MPTSALFAQASEQIKVEILHGNYVEVKTVPLVISPLGVIEKPGGGIRIIHDCSRPPGGAVNDYAPELDKQRFQSVDCAAKLVKPGWFMAKVDLKSAYRSVNISAHSQLVTGLKWHLGGEWRYFYDTKLPFGARASPGIFHRLTQAIRRIMSSKGLHNIVAYLDDFFICESSFEKCAETMRILIQLLRQLGFDVNWKKVVDPCQSLVFLGVEISSVDMQVKLPADKLQALKHELLSFAGRKRATKRQLQSLVGKLSWSSAVIRGGRVFLRRMINAIAVLKRPSHKTRIDDEIRADLHWWIHCMHGFNGKALLLETPTYSAVYTDSCSAGAGTFWGNDWFYCCWNLDCAPAEDLHINEKELMTVVLAAARWCHEWRNQRIYVFSDNTVTVAGVNKGTSRNPLIMECLRYLFWLSVTFNFHLRAIHIKGKYNDKADMLSRLHEPGVFEYLLRSMPYDTPLTALLHNMSHDALSFLLSRLGRHDRCIDSGR